jgi:hypothetical protein
VITGILAVVDLAAVYSGKGGATNSGLNQLGDRTALAFAAPNCLFSLALWRSILYVQPIAGVEPLANAIGRRL